MLRCLSLRSSVLTLAVLVAAAACAPTVTKHGHRLETVDLDQVRPGVTSSDEVLRLLGSPSTVATFDNQRWYYISQRTEQASFYQKDLVAQDVVAITFDERGIVRDVATRDIEQAQVVKPDPDQTRTLGNELTLVEQLIGNIGRFNTEPAGVGSRSPGSRR